MVSKPAALKGMMSCWTQGDFCSIEIVMLEFEPQSSNLSLEAGIWPWGWNLALRLKFGFETGIWVSRLGFEPLGWDLSLEVGISASKLGFEPWSRDLSLKAGIWASRLRFELWGWDLTLEAEEGGELINKQHPLGAAAQRATDCARWLLGYLSENFYFCYMAQTK